MYFYRRRRTYTGVIYGERIVTGKDNNSARMRSLPVLGSMDYYPTVWLGIFFSYWFLIADVNSSALLTANIRTLQVAACETEDLMIKCPGKTTIHIQFANYGRQVSSRERPCHNTVSSAASRSNFSIFHSHYDIDEESRDCVTSGSREKVISMCQDKRSCRIPVNVETFKQDPCPRTWKYLEVAYKCKPNVFHEQVVCEGDQMTLECELHTHRLAIQSAMFGRDRSGGNSICPDKNTREAQIGTGTREDCMSSFAAEMAMTKCQNERVCTLFADEATFGNQCPPNTRKYLLISYACVPQKLLISPSSRTSKGPHRLEEKAEDYLAGDRDDDQSIDGEVLRPLTAIDMQAIQPDLSRGQGRNGGTVGREGKMQFAQSTESTVTRCNCSESVSFMMDWIVAYQKIAKNRTACLIYAGVAAGIGLFVILMIVVLHCLLRHRSKKRLAALSTVTSSQSSSKPLNQKFGKDHQRTMPLYSTRYAEENEEAESLQQQPTVVDLTRYAAPRTTLPRAVSLTADGRRQPLLDTSRSAHRLTTDGSFYT